MTLLNTIEKTGEERQKDVKAIGRSLLADNMLSRLEADIGQMIRFVLKLGTGYTERVNKQLGMIREMRE